MSFRYRHGDRPLDGYTVQRGVGRGAFGEVYYAISDGGREVALKTVLQNHEIELRGVRHCINLKSPHLVSIFDVRKLENGEPAVIMEYVAGPSLRDLVREFPEGMPRPQAAFLVREIGKGLAYLHEKGIVHRDLKPENLFFEDGFVKIGDYGLSKYVSVSRQSGQTMSVGTIHYMAPEIGSGIYNQGIDIYALGIILYELLTGKVPFGGDSFGEILMKHLTAKPDLSAVEEPFRSVIAKALEKKPEDRWLSVEEMCAALFEDEALQDSLHLFNPASLSGAVRRAAPDLKEPNPASPEQETIPANAPTPEPPPAPRPEPPRAPTPEPPARPTPQAPRAPAAAEATPTTFPPRRDKPRDRRSQRDRASGAKPHPAKHSRDPLDLGQRIGRAVSTALVVSIAIALTRGGYAHALAAVIGMLFAIGCTTLSILACEGLLTRSFAVASPGFPRRLTAGLFALIPIGLGMSIVLAAGAHGRAIGGATLAFAISVVLADWSARLDPHRAERVALGDAVAAGLLGGLFALVFSHDAGAALVVGGSLAAISLSLNSIAPFVPKHRRGASQQRPPEPAEPSGARYREFRDRSGPAAAPAAPPPPPSPTTPKDVPMWVEEISPASAGQPGHVWQNAAASLRPDLSRAPAPPGAFARVFWLFISALLVAGGLCCFAAPAVMNLHPEEELITISFGIGCTGMLMFALYRALWARKQGFFARSVRPFFLTCLATTCVICGYIFVMGPIHGYWRIDAEESFVTLTVGAAAFVLFSILLGFERLLSADDAVADAAGLRWAERPVHPFVRLFHLLLASGGGVAWVGLSSIAMFGGRMSDWGRLEFLMPGFVAFALGVFFLHQALRYRRGYLWEGTVRPFVLIHGVTAVIACGLILLWQPATYHGHRYHARIHGGMHEDDLMVTVGVAIVAAVFTAFAFFVRGRGRGLGRSRLLAWGYREADEPIHSAWLSLGTLFWIAALVLTLASTGLRLGLGEVLGLEAEMGAESYRLLSEYLLPAWLPVGCALVGSACVIFSRVRAGFAHLARGILAQAALHVAVYLVLAMGIHVRIAEFAEHRVLSYDNSLGGLEFLMNCIFATGLIGVLLLAWPASAKTAQRAGAAEPEGVVS